MIALLVDAVRSGDPDPSGTYHVDINGKDVKYGCATGEFWDLCTYSDAIA